MQLKLNELPADYVTAVDDGEIDWNAEIDLQPGATYYSLVDGRYLFGNRPTTSLIFVDDGPERPDRWHDQLTRSTS